MEAHSVSGRGSVMDRVRAVHLRMVDAVLGGDGLEGVAGLAAGETGGAVAIVVPRLGAAAASAPVPDLAALRRYVSERSRGRTAAVPPGVVAEVPIASGDERLGAVLLLGDEEPAGDALEFLHVAAVACLTEVAVEEARLEVEQNLRGSFLEELRGRDDIDPDDVLRRAARLGCDLSRGAVALCAELSSDRPRHVVATIAGEHPGALAQHMEGGGAGACTRCCPRSAAPTPRRRWPPRGGSPRGCSGTGPSACPRSTATSPTSGGRSRRPSSCSTSCAAPTCRSPRTSGPAPTGCCSACSPPTPRRCARSTRTPWRRWSRYDAQYSTDLVGTLAAYLERNCNMNATASAIYAHRHTVAYRLERVKELTGLDPLLSEDRERLGLGLKAYRIIAPRLHR